MVVAVAAALLDEDHLVDAAVLVAPEVLAQLGGRADAAAMADFGQASPRQLEAVPDVGATRPMLAVNVVMAERVAEELEALGAAPLGLDRVLVQEKPVTMAMLALTAWPIGTH